MSDGTAPVTYAVILCPSVYYGVWHDWLSQLSIQYVLLSTVSQFKQLARDRNACGLPITHVVIDGNVVRESLRQMIESIFGAAPRASATVILPTEEESKYTQARYEPLPNAILARVQRIPAEALGRSVILSLFGRDSSNHLNLAPERARARDQVDSDYDDISLPPNELSQTIAQELSTLSGSIHLDDRLLRDGYCVTRGTLTSSPENTVPDDTRFVTAEYNSCIARWRQIETSRNDFAKEVIHHFMTTEPDNDEPAFYFHKLFAQLLCVPNRRTYLIVGPKGSGKTTFQHFFGLFYAPQRLTLIADFVPFNFVADVSNIVHKLEKEAFVHLKRDGRSALVEGCNTYYDFRAKISEDSFGPLYDELDRLGITLPQSLLLDWVDEVLHSCTTAELIAIWEHATYKREATPDSELPSAVKEARRWRNSVAAAPPRDLIKYLVRRYLEAWRNAPREWLARQVIEDVVRIATLPGANTSRRGRAAVNAVAQVAKQDGVIWSQLTTYTGPKLVTTMTRLLRLLGTAKNPVCVLIDNADRAVTPLTELAIFKDCWASLFDKTGRIKVAFAIRTETHRTHQDFFARLSQAEEPLDTADHATRITNFAELAVKPPSFGDILHARLYAIDRQLQQRSVDEKGSRPKSWWKLGHGATLSGSPFLTTCYAASKYLSRTDMSIFQMTASLAA